MRYKRKKGILCERLLNVSARLGVVGSTALLLLVSLHIGLALQSHAHTTGIYYIFILT